MSNRYLICGARVVDIYSGYLQAQDILIQDEQITTVGNPGTVFPPQGAEVVDASGCFAVPGLWDAHIHLTTYPQLQERLPALLVGHGVTSVRDMGGALDNVLAAHARLNQPGALGPRLWFAGPLINSSPKWGNDKSVEADTAEEAFALVDKLVAAGVHFVKPYEMLTPEVFAAVIQRATHHGLRAAGHIPGRMTIAEVLDILPNYDIQHLGGQCTGMKFDCARHAEQLHQQRNATFDAQRVTVDYGAELMLAVEQAVPVALADQDPHKRDALIQLFVEKGTWHTPTLITTNRLQDLGFAGDDERLRGLAYMPGALLDSYQQTNEQYRYVLEPRYDFGPWFAETVGLMHTAGVPMLAGTDCPPVLDYAPGLAVHFELQALVQAGLSPLAALQTATLSPARFFAVEDKLGSIATGKLADMVLLKKNPLDDIRNTRQIAAVFCRGQYFKRQKIDGLLNDLTESAA